uniref:VMA21-like domain protein n=1 Tax=Podoviridae sp. ctXBg1 TaxID=2827739 RepID=A0A8S5SRA5_9CAUD|nr:MAG TPA: VMA21-like domain protein [Podoviridae sp. ctXBg1]
MSIAKLIFFCSLMLPIGKFFQFKIVIFCLFLKDFY